MTSQIAQIVQNNITLYLRKVINDLLIDVCLQFSAMESQYRKLMDNFRLTIRRKKIDEVLHKQRHEFLQAQIQNHKEQLKQILSSKQSRKAWLNDVALKLTGFPDFSWLSLLNNLFYSLPLFQNDFEEWQSLGIIKQVCELFSRENAHLNLRKTAANILTDLFYLCSKHQNYRIIKYMLELKFTDNLTVLMVADPANEYIRLMAIVCEVAPNMRNYFITHQLLEFVIYRVKFLHQGQSKSQQSFHAIFYLIYTLVKSHQFDLKTFSRPKKVTIMAILQILSREIQENHSSNNISLILKSLKQICLVDKQQVYDQIIRHQIILDKAIELICFQSRSDVRYQSTKFLCNFLLSSQPEHSKYLSNKGILSKISQSYSLKNNKQQNKYMLLSFMSNFTADYKQQQQQFVMHPIMMTVMEEAQSSYDEVCYYLKQNIRREAIYCICNILRGSQQQFVYNRLFQIGVIETLVANLDRVEPQTHTVKQILSTLKEVLSSHSQFEGSHLLYRVLKNKYDINEILERLSEIDNLEDEVLEFSYFYTELQMS